MVTRKLVAKLLTFGMLLGLGAFQAQAADKTGIYVAPKMSYSYTVMDSMRGYGGSWNSAGTNVGSINAGLGNDNDSAFGGALAVGYNFDVSYNLPVRAEVEYGFFSEVEASGSRSFTANGTTERYRLRQKSDIQTLFVNAYYDIKTGTEWTPYLGAGIGMAFVDTKLDARGTYGADSFNRGTSKDLNTNFAWNIGAGIGWDVHEMVTIDLGYRFSGLGEAETKTATYTSATGDTVRMRSKIQDIYMHQVILGLRLNF